MQVICRFGAHGKNNLHVRQMAHTDFYIMDRHVNFSLWVYKKQMAN